MEVTVVVMHPCPNCEILTQRRLCTYCTRERRGKRVTLQDTKELLVLMAGMWDYRLSAPQGAKWGYDAA